MVLFSGQLCGCSNSEKQSREGAVVAALSEVNNWFILTKNKFPCHPFSTFTWQCPGPNSQSSLLLLSTLCVVVIAYYPFYAGAGPDHEFRIGRIKHERVKVSHRIQALSNCFLTCSLFLRCQGVKTSLTGEFKWWGCMLTEKASSRLTFKMFLYAQTDISNPKN